MMSTDRVQVLPLEQNEDHEYDNAKRFMDRFKNERSSQLIESLF